MTAIIEYIGKNKIVHTDHAFRLRTPRPGDVIDFGENTEYPYHNPEKRFGRIDNLDSFGSGMISICCELGSVFLGENHVDISGGPFDSVHPDELEPTYQLKLVRFWNWGNNLPGADKGIDYWIMRPIFRLKKRGDQEKARVAEYFNEQR